MSLKAHCFFVCHATYKEFFFKKTHLLSLPRKSFNTAPPMTARHARDFTWNRGWSLNSPPLTQGDQIPYPLEDSDNQIPSFPGWHRCQMPGVCPGGMLKLRFDRYIRTQFFQLPLSSFLFPLYSFSFPDLSRKDRGDSASRVDCRSFSVLTILTGSRPGKSSKCLLPSFPSAFARFARFPRSRDHPEGLLAAATPSTLSYGVLFCSKQFEYIYAFIALSTIV